MMGIRNITLSLDEKLVREARKIPVDHGTTLNGLVPEYLESSRGKRRGPEGSGAMISGWEKPELISMRVVEFLDNVRPFPSQSQHQNKRGCRLGSSRRKYSYARGVATRPLGVRSSIPICIR